MTRKMRDRIKGMFLGIAIGDALGMPYEKVFTTEQLLAMPDDLLMNYQNPAPGHPFHNGLVSAGMTTDDTQLTVSVAESLIACGEIYMDDMRDRHILAMDERISGWGKGTLSAIQNLKDGMSWEDSGNPNGAGNGVMMKISPVGAYLATLPKNSTQFGAILEKVLDLAYMTHKSRMGLAQGWIHASLIKFCLEWENNTEDLDFPDSCLEYDCQQDFEFNFLYSAINECIKIEGWWTGKDIDTIKERLVEPLLDLLYAKHYQESLLELGKRYGERPFFVYDSLPLAYACFLKNHDSFEAVINAIRVGGDTDTNASIVGALLGAKNGTKVFPQHLIDGLKDREKIINLAERFCDTF